MEKNQNQNKGIFTFEAPWPIYAVAWSMRQEDDFSLAVGSFLGEDHCNKVGIVRFNSEKGELIHDPRLLFDHPYPPTKLMFIPDSSGSNPDIIATSGDYIRLWEVKEDKITIQSHLNNNKSNEFNSAITSFDWADFDLNRIVCSSIDTTCTVWNLETEMVEAQLVAHDKQVYDISWGAAQVFASVSGDGSLRVFDLRDKEHSTIIYENQQPEENPILRVEWNKRDSRFLATVGMDSTKVVVLDIRYPMLPFMELNKHQASINGVSWSNRSGQQLCSVGDDGLALIWDITSATPIHGYNEPEGGIEPTMWYSAGSSLNQVQWRSVVDSDWISVTFLHKMQVLRI